MENYVKVDLWYDGSPMTPSKADGVIYKLENGIYYKRKIKNSTVNPLWWGIKDDGDPDFDTTPGNTHYSLNWEKMKIMIDLCIQMELNIHFPKGEFSCGNANFPFNYHASDDPTPPLNELKDLKNIIISGEGRGTVLRSDSQTGADVLQLNSIKNITFRDLAVTATVAIKDPQNGAVGGSNGVSITNGFDNITLENIHVFDLDGVEFEGYIDGAKAFTIQNAENIDLPNGKLKIINCSSKNNAYGWRHDGFLSNVMKDNMDLDISLTIEKSWMGFSIAFADATDYFDEFKRINYKTNVSLIDCQQDVFLGRLYGGDFNFYVQSEKTISELKTNPLTGLIWKKSTKPAHAFFEIVTTAYLAYVKHSNINVFGYKKHNNYKYFVGCVGSIIEQKTEGRTEDSNLLLKLAGDVTDTELMAVSYLGNSVFQTSLQIENFNGVIPAEFLSSINRNLVIVNKKIVSSSFYQDNINLGDYSSVSSNEYGGVKIKQTYGAHGYLSVIEAFSNSDERLFSVNNYGEVLLKNSTKIVTGDALPNGNILANRGSIYLRRVGGASYSIWLKTTDNDEFGWKLVPVIENCTTATRPNLTLTDDVGKMIFDTDIGCHVIWTGIKWIKYNFVDA